MRYVVQEHWSFPNDVLHDEEGNAFAGVSTHRKLLQSGMTFPEACRLLAARSEVDPGCGGRQGCMDLEVVDEQGQKVAYYDDGIVMVFGGAVRSQLVLARSEARSEARLFKRESESKGRDR